MAYIGLANGVVRIEFQEPPPPTHRNQLDLWHFRAMDAGRIFSATSESPQVHRLLDYFERRGESCLLSPAVREVLLQKDRARAVLAAARERAGRYKETGELGGSARDLWTFLQERVTRPLKGHQIKAAVHLHLANNGANFSTPGSGKTAVVLSVFAYLRSQGILKSLLVVGPISCFEPWRREYQATLGRAPTVEVLSGQHPTRRRLHYQVAPRATPDLRLISFQTLAHDVEHIERLLRLSDVRVMLVVDEAHYMKKIDGMWASALQQLAKSAARRVVLTGTPFPHSYRDSFNLFDFLWPEQGPFSEADKGRITMLCQSGQVDTAAETLRDTIGPLFYRVRKKDLELAPQRFRAPVVTPMASLQARLYAAILTRIVEVADDEEIRDVETTVALKRARIIRLRQCASWPALLRTAIPECPDYDENLLSGRGDLAESILRYESHEEPGKLTALRQLVAGLRHGQLKVVVWSTFVGTIQMLTDACTKMGIVAEALHGGIELDDRERIIRSFNDPSGSVEVIVANPAACAESVSLHVSCQDAIYYDLSYNCAQFLQSLDRIHRVGGSEQREARYQFLIAEASIDMDVLDNVQKKADLMRRVIDAEYPVYSLDMEDKEADREDVDAYDRLVRTGK